MPKINADFPTHCFCCHNPNLKLNGTDTIHKKLITKNFELRTEKFHADAMD
jgi:hypothetical protein